MPLTEGEFVRLLTESTAGEVGENFFAVLVRTVASALDVSGCWVTEYLREANRLRAFSFWFDGAYVADYEYDIAGTPCEQVVRAARLVHYPDCVIELFPGDPELARLNAVSYLSAPLIDKGGEVAGNLAVLDTRRLELSPQIEALFRVFTARAGAELRRIRTERAVRDSEQRFAGLFDSTMDAIVELSAELAIERANRSAEGVFSGSREQLAGRSFLDLLCPDSGRKLRRLCAQLESRKQDRLWVPGGFDAIDLKGERFPAEASLSKFEAGGKGRYTLVLRNLRDQLAAEARIRALEDESDYLRTEIAGLQRSGELLGRSRAMGEVLTAIGQVAPTTATVLILGETGTGKELVARAVHAGSPRAAKPLVKVNCPAIPAALIESDLFGHEKGAFTGATERRAGRFGLADGGTIFLDEIGELPLELQPKLLRVLQEGEFEPVGSSQTRKVDVRVIAATNRDLAGEVKAGRFREDLYYRLSVFPIVVPPLRRRSGDVELLARAIVERFARRMGSAAPELTHEDLRRLRSYSWPGNVRELENVLERAMISARGGRLSLAPLLPGEGRETATAPPAAAGATAVTRQDLLEMERQNLLRALEQTGWKVAGDAGAARLVGMPPSTFNSRMKALDIRRPREISPARSRFFAGGEMPRPERIE